MINAEKFSEITNEVESLIDNALYQLFLNYPEDYVLFMASGEFDEIIARDRTLNLSPYTISGHNIENYYDSTRQHFLCEFLNTYYSFADRNELKDDEYRMNIEFLIYTHIWEAKPFLKRLYRLANLLCGKEYDWKIQIPSIGKSNFIKNKIIKPFNASNCILGKIISDNYKTDLRNAIAHSDYQIDIISKEITYNSKTVLCNTSFNDWSIHFAYSVCFSYYFSRILTQRRKQIILDWGKNFFTIKRPSSDGLIQHVCIQYEIENDEFGFILR